MDKYRGRGRIPVDSAEAAEVHLEKKPRPQQVTTLVVPVGVIENNHSMDDLISIANNCTGIAPLSIDHDHIKLAFLPDDADDVAILVGMKIQLKIGRSTVVYPV